MLKIIYLKKLKQKIINILLPLPFNQTFQYLCDEEEKVKLGDFVLVPFKDRIVTGCIWENKNKLKKKLPNNVIFTLIIVFIIWLIF